MDNQSLEKRVTELEKEVAELKDEVRKAPGKDDWLKTVGWANDDPGFTEMMELGRKYRERQRKQEGKRARARHKSPRRDRA